MHASSYSKMAQFRANYKAWGGFSVLDVGAANHIWNYKGIFHDCQYSTLEPADTGATETRGNSDFIVDDYDWSALGSKQYEAWDVVICGQVLEHDKYFWKTCTNIGNAVKPGGYAVILVPSAGPIHRFPVDVYRFYPDAAEVFAEYTGMKIVEVIHDTSGISEWNDLCVILKK